LKTVQFSETPPIEDCESPQLRKPIQRSASKSVFDDSDDDQLEADLDLGQKPQDMGRSQDDVLNFDNEPYRRAIQSLKKLSHLKSPRDKLGCILITFMDIIQCVTDFWEVHGREPIVGADDLVPIFSYVILKARVPKLFSEMSYIWEFATDTEMKGKYGYGFATFQIGVQVIARLSLDQLEATKKLEDSKIDSKTPVDPSKPEDLKLGRRASLRDILANTNENDPLDTTGPDSEITTAMFKNLERKRTQSGTPHLLFSAGELEELNIEFKENEGQDDHFTSSSPSFHSVEPSDIGQ